MANEQLRAAIREAGHTYESLAAEIPIDPKSVERWVTQGRAPHAANRRKAALLLGRDVEELWPQDPPAGASGGSPVGFEGLFPNRGAVPHELWYALAREATDHIDLLAYGGTFLHDSLSELDDILVERANAGVEIRLLFGDPDSEAVQLRGREEGIGEELAGRCRLTWKYFARLIDCPGVQARKHGQTLYNSIFRFDDALLANAHTLGVAASQNPVLHIRDLPHGHLFGHYIDSFDRTWEQASPFTG